MKKKALRLMILEKYDTIGDFADVLKMDQTTLSSHLSGRRQMRSQTILKFANALGIKQADIGRIFFPELEERDGIQEDDKEAN